MTIVGRGGAFEVPQLWQDRHWDRPYHYLRSLSTRDAQADPRLHRTQTYIGDQLAWWTDVQAAISRSSLMLTQEREIERGAFNALVRAAYRGLANEPWLFGGVATTGVEGWQDYAWLLANEPRRLDPNSAIATRTDLYPIAQGQAFLGVEGALFVFGINWAFVEAQGIDPDVAYAHALVSVGRLGHLLLLEGQHHGLVARMTPAVHESSASALFGLDDDRDVLYVIMFAYPADAT